MKRLFSIFFLIFALVSISFATTVYIGHKQTVIMRNTAASTGTVVLELSKNTPVELLKTDIKNGYSYVQTNKGEVGWVRTDYLVSNLKKPKGFFATLWDKAAFWRHSPLAKQTVIEPIKPINETTDDSDSNSQLIADLQSQVQQLQQQQQTLQQQQAVLVQQQKSNWRWFLIGALIGVIGVLLGFLIGLFHRRQKNRWFVQ